MIKISVAVPVRNESSNIAELLRDLINQTRPPDEIVVTDGGSTDSTPQIVDAFIRAGAPVKLIRAGDALPGRGRNLAVAEVSSDWIAFIDGGVQPVADWLDSLATRAETDPNIDVVYGGWEPVTSSFFTECAAIAYVPPPISTNGVITRPRFIASSLMKQKVWQAVGGFPEDLRSGEDLLFMNRIESAGFNAVFEPRALVRWQLRPTFASTFKKFLVYARNNIRAGLWRQWQAAIFTRYVMLAGVGIVAGAVSSKLLWVPFSLWVLMLVARAAVSIRRNRDCYPANLGHNLRRLLLLVPLIATIDVAAIIGSFQWLILDCVRGRGKTVVETRNGA